MIPPFYIVQQIYILWKIQKWQIQNQGRLELLWNYFQVYDLPYLLNSYLNNFLANGGDSKTGTDIQKMSFPKSKQALSSQSSLQNTFGQV